MFDLDTICFNDGLEIMGIDNLYLKTYDKP